MRVMVIGGTGFIGYHVVKELEKRSISTVVLSRNLESARSKLGDQIEYVQGDLNFFRDIPFEEIFKDIDVLVYAAGIDEREAPQGDPYAFFYKENVTTCVNMLEMAKNHGVKHAIVLGSIFSYFDREYPEMRLSKYHPYIRSRVEQSRQALLLADEQFQVNIAEIPFVFGYTPGQETIWKTLVNYIKVANPIVATPGGANVMSVSTLAQAIIGIILYIKESGAQPVGDRNMTWIEIQESLSKLVNAKPKPIKILKEGIFNDLTQMGAFVQKSVGIKSGLDHHQISELITFEAFFETKAIKKKLNYQGGDTEKAFEDTVQACPNNMLIDNLQKSMDWFSDSAKQTRKAINKMTTPKK